MPWCFGVAFAGKPPNDLDLHGIGILKFIDQDA